MDPYNADAARAVWARVTGAGGGGDDDQSALAAMIADALAAKNAYAALSMRAGGQTGSRLRAIARDEERNARELSALYFARTGERAKPDTAPPELPADFAAALRERYALEVKSAANFTRAAENDFAARALFSRIASSELRHSEALLQLLAACLARPL